MAVQKHPAGFHENGLLHWPTQPRRDAPLESCAPQVGMMSQPIGPPMAPLHLSSCSLSRGPVPSPVQDGALDGVCWGQGGSWRAQSVRPQGQSSKQLQFTLCTDPPPHWASSSVRMAPPGTSLPVASFATSPGDQRPVPYGQACHAPHEGLRAVKPTPHAVLLLAQDEGPSRRDLVAPPEARAGGHEPAVHVQPVPAQGGRPDDTRRRAAAAGAAP